MQERFSREKEGQLWQQSRSEVQLTAREKEILHLVAMGLENGKIAEE